MVEKFDMAPDRFWVESDEGIVFDTARRSTALFPDSSKITYTGGVSFPDFIKGNAYISWIESGFANGAAGRSYITLLTQEWGYGITTNAAANQFNIAQTLIGTVPAGTDYLDIQATLTRTTAPSASSNGAPAPVLIPEGVPFQLQGGSCAPEMGSFARLFEFVLVSGALPTDPKSVYLRRYQSVGNNHPTWNVPNSDSTSRGWTWGAISNNPPSVAATAEHCVLATVLDKRGPGAPNGMDRRRAFDNDRANIPGRSGYVDPTSFATVFSGTIVIHPGRINN